MPTVLIRRLHDRRISASWWVSTRRDRRRKLQWHGRIAEEDPGTANVVVGDARLRLDNRLSDRHRRICLEKLQQRLIHGSLRRLIREPGGCPDRYCTAIRRQKQGFSQAG